MQTLKTETSLQGGKYKIKEVLGQGGFGITYLAEHTLLGGNVAIKEFFMKELNNRDDVTSQVSVGSDGSRELVLKFKEKFLKEARNIFKLNHPNIIHILDIFEENGTAYYVMEYCSGGSLSGLLKQYTEGLSEDLALLYIKEIASAVDYIHQRKINHLDIKPGNIMLDENGQAILIDFGLSKQYDAETGQQTSTTPVGISEGYAPIEQYKKGGLREFSPATDIYALGATLYKLITGDTPPSALELGEEDLPDFTAAANIKKAITTAMSPKRKDRPQTVTSWTDLLVNSENSEQKSEATLIVNKSEELAIEKKGNFDKIPYILAACAILIVIIIYYMSSQTVSDTPLRDKESWEAIDSVYVPNVFEDSIWVD